LRARWLLRPPVDTLARLIATARANAHRNVKQLLASQLAPERRRQLDALLDGADGQASGVAELRREPASRSCSPSADLPAGSSRSVAVVIDVSALPPARRRALEALGRRMTAQQLRRLEPARRHPLMLGSRHQLRGIQRLVFVATPERHVVNGAAMRSRARCSMVLSGDGHALSSSDGDTIALRSARDWPRHARRLHERRRPRLVMGAAVLVFPSGRPRTQICSGWAQLSRTGRGAREDVPGLPGARLRAGRQLGRCWDVS